MFKVTLESDGETGIFCADIFHNPVQVLEPHVNTSFCMLAEQARQTRREFLEEVANTGAIGAVPLRISTCRQNYPEATSASGSSQYRSCEAIKWNG